MTTTTKTSIDSYLTFKLGEEEFAANVSTVLNILELTKITKVPKAPPYMKGVINLRGEVLPVVDTRIKFGMDATEFNNNTCILVLDIELNGEQIKVGSLVDSVQEVLEIENETIQPPPSIGDRYKSEFISGMFLSGEDFIMLLDMVKIFSFEELEEIRNSTATAKI